MSRLVNRVDTPLSVIVIRMKTLLPFHGNASTPAPFFYGPCWSLALWSAELLDRRLRDQRLVPYVHPVQPSPFAVSPDCFGRQSQQFRCPFVGVIAKFLGDFLVNFDLDS